MTTTNDVDLDHECETCRAPITERQWRDWGECLACDPFALPTIGESIAARRAAAKVERDRLWANVQPMSFDEVVGFLAEVTR